MLITTGLIQTAKGLVRHIDRTNPTPFLHPIGVNIRKAVPGDFSIDGNVYKFLARSESTKIYWKWHIAILMSSVLFKIYIIKFEKPSFIALATQLFYGCGYTIFSFSVYVYHQKTERLTHLINELMNFEKRHIGVDAKEQKYWKQNRMRKVVVTLCNFFRLLLISLPWLFALSEALVPGAPWRYVPTVVWNAFPTHLVLFGWKLGYAFVVLRSVICFGYTFVLSSILAGYVQILVLFSQLIPVSALYFIIEHLRRKLRSSKYLNVDIPRTILMYRECRCLCDIYNDIHQQVIIPYCIIVPAIAGVATFLFVISSRWDTLDLESGLLSTNLLSLCASNMIIGFHFCVKLCIESESLLATQGHHFKGQYGKAAERVHKKTRDLWRRYSKSVPILCIRFFGNNFFARATPIVLLDFSIGLAINLLMTDRESK